jgi:hypothetical protein
VIRHRLPGGIPGHVGKQAVGGTQARRRIFGERRVDGGGELFGRVRNAGQSEIAIGMHNVGNRGGHDWPSTCEVLRCLGGTDVARRVVARERQDGHIPPRQVPRKFGVGFLAEIVDVAGLRQRRGIDLDDRSQQHQVPVRPQRGDPCNQIAIQPFIQHPEESNPRVRNRRLVGRFAAVVRSRACEMFDVDAAGKGMDVRVEVLFRFVEAAAAGKDDARPLEECALGLSKTRWSSREVRRRPAPARGR